MKKGDFLWLGTLGLIVAFLLYPSTHIVFVTLTKNYPYMMGFVKVGILATMGELLAVRIVTGDWNMPAGLFYRFVVWGLLGITFVTVFEIFAAGVNSAAQKALLPVASEGFAKKLSTAIWISTTMNLIFAPTMMALHRITDTYIELAGGKVGNLANVNLTDVVKKIDWPQFVGFVIVQTIPIFWIPAHTITFLLPAEYRVLMASMLSLALGGILAFAKRNAAKS